MIEQNINNICDNLKKQWRDNLRFFSNTIQVFQKELNDKNKQLEDQSKKLKEQDKIINQLISKKDGYIIKHRNGVWCFHPIYEFKQRRNNLNLNIDYVIKQCNLKLSKEEFENYENGLILFKNILVKVKFDDNTATILHNFYKKQEKIE